MLRSLTATQPGSKLFAGAMRGWSHPGNRSILARDRTSGGAHAAVQQLARERRVTSLIHELFLTTSGEDAQARLRQEVLALQAKAPRIDPDRIAEAREVHRRWSGVAESFRGERGALSNDEIETIQAHSEALTILQEKMVADLLAWAERQTAFHGLYARLREAVASGDAATAQRARERALAVVEESQEADYWRALVHAEENESQAGECLARYESAGCPSTPVASPFEDESDIHAAARDFTSAAASLEAAEPLLLECQAESELHMARTARVEYLARARSANAPTDGALFAHPTFWGPMVLVGEWARPISAMRH
jgi:hypothetical protein